MRRVLRASALGRPRGMGWRGRREGGSGWGTHVNPWLVIVNVWQKPLQYCKLISLQLIKINEKKKEYSVQFTQLCPILCDSMDCSTPGFPVHHQLLKLPEAHVHRISDDIQPPHPLLSPSPAAFNPSQHQGLFQ